MKITGVQLYRVSLSHDTWLWLSIETDEGITGWGELRGGLHGNAISEAVAQHIPRLYGCDPRRMLSLTNPFHEWTYPSLRFDRLHACVRSGIDQALHDVSSQYFQMPLYWFMGAYGQREIPLYANLNRRLRLAGGRSADALAQQASAAVQAGYKVLKCAPFDEVTPVSEPESFRPGMERIEAVLDVLPLSQLAIDCHQRFRTASVVQWLDLLRERGGGDPYWLEDPVSDDFKADIREIRQRYPSMRWAGGELALGFDDIWELAHNRFVDVVMPDVRFAGGVSGLKTILPIVEARGMRASIHNPAGPIGTAFSAHLTALVRHPLPMEYPFGFEEERNEAVLPKEPVEEGVYHLSDRHGIGVRPNPDFLERCGSVWRDGQWQPLRMR